MIKNSFFQKVCVVLLMVSSALFGQSEKPKVALVLSGGGAKGFAHIGVLKVFEEEKIPIDIIVGTSIGSIIGGLYSIGYTSEQLEEFVKQQDWQNLLTDNISREYIDLYEKDQSERNLLSFRIEDGDISLPSGMVQGQNIINLFCKMTKNFHDVEDFSKFPISFACIAADIETGEEVLLNKGYLPEAMSASMAIPTAFAPVELDGKLLVDGGIVNNFPTDVAKAMGADIIIGVDIQTGLLKREEIKELTDVLGQITSFLDYKKYLKNKKLCDIVIKPDITGFGTSSFSRKAADTLVVRGEQVTRRLVPQIKKILSKNNITGELNREAYKQEEITDLSHFMVEGMNASSVSYLYDKLNLDFPSKVSDEEISNAINRLYGAQAFNKAYYKILDDSNKVFQVKINERNTNSINVGFNYNSEDHASLLLNLKLQNPLVGNTRFNLDVILSVTPTVRTSLQYSPKNLPQLGFDLLFRKFDMDVYEKENRLGTADADYIRSDFYSFGTYGTNYFFGFGLRGEYHKYNAFISNQINNTNIGENEKGWISLFGKIVMDNLDHKYFPNSGYSFLGELNYSAKEFHNIFNSTKITTVMGKFKSAIRLGSDVTMISQLQGRMIFGDINEIFRMNFIGGYENTTYLDHHFSFLGIKRVISVRNKVFLAKEELRLRLTDSQFLSFMVDVATDYDEFENWKSDEFMFGAGIKYSLNSVIGPVDFVLSYSDYTDEMLFYVNIGKWLF